MPRLEIMRVTFRHLYDEHWGMIYKEKRYEYNTEQRWMIFPQDFQPITGEKYDCFIQWTMTGVFIYKDKRYDIARAHLENKAGIIDEIDYKYRKEEKLESPLAFALRNFTTLDEDKMIKVYLACPYYHPGKIVMEDRFERVCEKTAELMEMGYVVFSPISHSHRIKEYVTKDNWKFWRRQDLPLIKWCDEFHILCLEGWKESIGVNEELDYANLLNKKIVKHIG